MEIIYGKKSLKKNNKIFVSDEDFQMPFGEDSFKIPLDKLNEIEKSTIKGKYIPELFSYQDFSTWWFVHPNIYPKMKQYISFIIKFNEFLDKESPVKVIVNDDFTMFDIIKQICNNKKIEFEYSKLKYFQSQISKKIIIKAQKYRYKKITNRKINHRKNLFKKKKNSFNSIDDKIIFVTPTGYRRHILNLESGKSEKGEYIVQPIMDFINDRKNLLAIDVDYTFKGNYNIFAERLESKISWIPVEVLSKKNQVKKNEHKIFTQKYKQIISDKNFQKLFVFNGISIWSHLESEFEKMGFHSNLPLYLELYDSLVTIFQTKKPKTIFLPYETGPFALAFILAAKKFNIRTIGLAHAIIAKTNPMYSYYRLRTKQDPFGFPISDFTLVFGNHSKQVLEQQGYPSNQFIVFGNPSFFNLKKTFDILKSKPLYSKYDINKNQKIILFTTELLQEAYFNRYGKYNYDTQILNHLLQNFADKNEWIVIIKPHPNENTDIYEKLIKKFNAPNFQIIQGDLFELIYISSVVISIFSTTMTDAICLDKPVIRVTFENFKHVLPYDEFGVVISTEIDNLTSNIKKIIEDSRLRDDLKKNRDKFIKEQYNVPEESPKMIIEKLLDNE